jgi:hypothetical protein
MLLSTSNVYAARLSSRTNPECRLEKKLSEIESYGLGLISGEPTKKGRMPRN